MRLAAFLLVMLAVTARAQPFFADDFERGVKRVDAGGAWTEIYDVDAVRTVGAVAAHRGDAGVRINRTMNFADDNTDTQLEVVTALAQGGESWVRWWMRVNTPTRLGPQGLLGFGDTLVSNHITFFHDPTGLFLTCYQGDGGYFFQRADDLPDAGWHLYELGVMGMGSVDGGLQLVIDGRTTVAVSVPFDFADVGHRQVNLGMTYGQPRTFQGAVDYDDVRASLTQPAGRTRVGGFSGPSYAGECSAGRLDFTTSAASVGIQTDLDDVNQITFLAPATMSLFQDSACMQPMPQPLVVGPATRSLLFYAVSSVAGTSRITAATPDLLSDPGVWLFLPARDAGVLDAGIDAGQPDAGPPDAGAPDAGAPDAGAPDAGPPDAGAPDAGRGDAGGLDAGATGDGGVAQTLQVGCACSGTPFLSWLLPVLWLVSRPRSARCVRRRG